ncbi:MAG: DUF924 family protein [Cyanobacteria bacterium P01_G01_bin.19]
MSKSQFSEVLNFWFAESTKPKWFKKSPEFDREIKQRFESMYCEAKTGELDDWSNVPHSALALIILLDQFPRNMYRQTSQAFATDDRAVELAKHAIAHNYQQSLTKEQQTFLYMPLMHSEDRSDQAMCVKLFEELGKEDNLKFARKHQEIINRFDRFPHRNQTLGRKSTSAEQEFLTQPGSSF